MAGRKKNETEAVEAVASDNRLETSEFKALLKALQKENGENSIIKASDKRVTNFHRIPTNIFQLDYALNGGIPVGRINLFFGDPSSMKTSLIYKIIGNAQHYCSNCWVSEELHGEDGTNSCEKFSNVTTAFIDVENTFDGAWAQTLGANCNDILVVRPPYAEKSIDTADQLLRSGNIDILVIDSLAALVPLKEVEKSSEDMIVGTQAKLIGTLCRKTSNAMIELQNNTGKCPTIFWTNQVRQKITMFGDPNTMPGGLAFPFFASIMLKLQRKRSSFENDRERETTPLYVPIEFTLTKNKMGIPSMEGEFKLVTTATDEKRIGDIYDEDKVAEFAEKTGLYAKEGMKWMFQGEEIGTARSALERKLLIDPVFNQNARKIIMAKLLKK